MSLGVVYQRDVLYLKRDSGAVVTLRDAAAPGSIPAHSHALSSLQQSGASIGQAIVWNGAAWVPQSIAAVPGGASGQVQWNNAGVFAGLPLSYSAATGLLEHSPTWNSPSTAFTGLRVNPTDTASDNASRLLALQVGGVDRFSLTKRGNARWDHVSGSWATIDDGLSVGSGGNRDVIVGPAVSGVSIRQGQQMQFSSNASDAYFDRADLTLTRLSAGGMQVYSGHIPADNVAALTLNSLSGPGSHYAAQGRGFMRFEINGALAGVLGYEGGYLAMTGQNNGLMFGNGPYHDYGHLQISAAGIQFNAHLNQYGYDTADRTAFQVLARKTGGAGNLANAALFRVDTHTTPGVFAINPAGKLRFATTDTAPPNTATPDAWLAMQIGPNGGPYTNFRIPLHLA